jgi:hypothetical protein
MLIIRDVNKPISDMGKKLLMNFDKISLSYTIAKFCGVNFGQGSFSSLEVKNLRLISRKKAQNIQGEDRRSIFHRNTKCLVQIVDYFHEGKGRDASNRL